MPDTPTHPTPAMQSFTDVPLDELIDLPVHEMSPEELAAYVQRCHLLQVSAQTRRATMRKEGAALGAEKKPSKAKKKNNVALAQDMLAKLLAGKA
jgi:hypothetical protein